MNCRVLLAVALLAWGQEGPVDARPRPRTTTSTTRPTTSTTRPSTTTTTSSSTSTSTTLAAGSAIPTIPQLQVGAMNMPPVDLGKPLILCESGDNGQGCIVVRRVYANPDEQWFAAIGPGANIPATYIRVAPGSPAGFYMTPTIGSAANVPPLIEDIGGSIPAGYAVWAAVAGENCLWGTPTGTNPLAWACHNVTAGGVNVSYPYQWPVPFPPAPIVLQVFFTLDPHPCPATVTAPPHGITVALDILQSRLQKLPVTVLDIPEHFSPSPVNWAAPPAAEFHDTTVGIPIWTANMVTQVDWPFQAPAASTWQSMLHIGDPIPDGFSRIMWGRNCQYETLSDGSVIGCSHCDRHRGVGFTLGTTLPPLLSTTLPQMVPQADGGSACVRRGGAIHGSMFVAVPVAGDRGLVYLVPSADGKTLKQIVGGP